MARPPKPIKHTPAWTIFRTLENWCLERNFIPSQHAFYEVVISKEWPDMKLGKYNYYFDRLKKEGYIITDPNTGAIRLSTLTTRVRPGVIQDANWESKLPIEYVYLLDSRMGFFKIGVTNDPDGRMKQLGIQLPYKVDCIHLIASKYARRLEHVLHKKFAAQRTNGEWFTLSDEDIAYIKSITTYEVPRRELHPDR